MKIIFLLISFAYLNCKGQNNNSIVLGKYFGGDGMSRFIYVFKKSKTFSFSTYGHFGKTKTLGVYTIVKDTIFTKSLSQQNQKNKNSINISDTFLINSDSCITSIKPGYDYCMKNKNQKFFYTGKKRLLTALYLKNRRGITAGNIALPPLGLDR